MADKLSYLGSVTLTPYHTQSMLPWVLAEIQSRSAEAGAKLECGFSFDETTLRLFSDDDHSLVLSHPILSISRFVHPRLSSAQSSLPTFAYLEKESTPSSNHNSYKIHAFQCFDRSQIESFIKLLNSALEAALALKSEREISGHDYQSALNACLFKMVAVGPVPTRTLTTANVDEIITSRLPGGAKNFSILAHLRQIDVPSVIRTGYDCLYLVNHYKTPKQNVIARRYIDVTGCSLGKIHSGAMAIVCRENQSSMCYCLQSDDPEITFMMSQKLQELVKQSLKSLQANRVTVCSSCPMNSFNELCRQLETLDDTSINSAIRTKFEAVVVDLQKEISTSSTPHNLSTTPSPSESVTSTPRHNRSPKSTFGSHYSDNLATPAASLHPQESDATSIPLPMGVSNNTLYSLLSQPASLRKSLNLENDAMMSLLRQHFESLQQKHQHVNDITGGIVGSSLKGGFLGNINKARKAVQGSIQDIKHMKNEIVEEASSSLLFSLPQKSIMNNSEDGAHTPKRWKDGNIGGLERQLKIFAGRIGKNQPTSAEDDHLEWLRGTAGFSSKDRRNSIPVFRGIPTWRQDIYTLVTTPIKKCAEESVGVVGYDNVLEIPMDFTDTSPLDVELSNQMRLPRRDYKALWKRVILDQILLIRMEKANSSLKGCFLLHVGRKAMVLFPSTEAACQDRVANRRCKLDFDDSIGGLRCPDELGEVWHDLLNEQPVENLTYDYIFAVVKSGIPKLVRGEAWKFLKKFNMRRLRDSHRVRMNGQALDSNSNYVENSTVVTPLSALEYEYDYKSLIRKKSKQQNDIFLDLDRTFPGHPYFAEKYGLGQLALYNVLRAYSIIDDDVGYCQGMSFVASILLMHVSEEEAFDLLRYLMQALNLRRQYRPPNMTGLQVKQYQLQRLLHDRLPKLHSHLQKLEIPPTLYATAWFLTLFSSQFPLGLVIRLFDLIFLDGPDVVFKVAIVILSKFEYLILSQSSFEAVVGVFKNQLPNLVTEHASDIIKATLDSSFDHLDKQLFAYEVEYQVMREEEIMNSPGVNANSTGKSSSTTVPKSGTSVDLASAVLNDRETNSGSSLQKHNEFCLEKVAALNKKLEREKYALELKSQQLKQQTYDLQDQVAAMQREEFKLHSAIVQLVQEREMLHGIVLRGNQNVVSPQSGSYQVHGRQEFVSDPTSDMTQELQLCNLSEILPEKLLKSCQITLNLSNVSYSNYNQSNFSTTDNVNNFHDGSNQFINTNVSYNNNSNERRMTSSRIVNTGASQFPHQCNGEAKLLNNPLLNSNHT